MIRHQKSKRFFRCSENKCTYSDFLTNLLRITANRSSFIIFVRIKTYSEEKPPNYLIRSSFIIFVRIKTYSEVFPPNNLIRSSFIFFVRINPYSEEKPSNNLIRRTKSLFVRSLGNFTNLLRITFNSPEVFLFGA